MLERSVGQTCTPRDAGGESPLSRRSERRALARRLGELAPRAGWPHRAVRPDVTAPAMRSKRSSNAMTSTRRTAWASVAYATRRGTHARRSIGSADCASRSLARRGVTPQASAFREARRTEHRCRERASNRVRLPERRGPGVGSAPQDLTFPRRRRRVGPQRFRVELRSRLERGDISVALGLPLVAS